MHHIKIPSKYSELYLVLLNNNLKSRTYKILCQLELSHVTIIEALSDIVRCISSSYAIHLWGQIASGMNE